MGHSLLTLVEDTGPLKGDWKDLVTNAMSGLAKFKGFYLLRLDSNSGSALNYPIPLGK